MGLKMAQRTFIALGLWWERSTGLQEEHSQDVVVEGTDLFISVPIWNKMLLCK